MKIFVVRHGETTGSKEELFRGRTDVPLNERGFWQADRTGTFFFGKGVSAIYSSPLTRATQTASRISQSVGVPVTVDNAFIDMEFGPWDGLSLAAVRERFPELLDTWRLCPQRFRLQGAETLARVRKRVVKGLRRAITDGPTDGLTDGTADGLPKTAAGLRPEPVVLIVTHRVVCKLLALHFLGMPNRLFWKVKSDPASIALAEKAGDEFALSMLNQTLHLQDFTGSLDLPAPPEKC